MKSTAFAIYATAIHVLVFRLSDHGATNRRSCYVCLAFILCSSCVRPSGEYICDMVTVWRSRLSPAASNSSAFASPTSDAPAFRFIVPYDTAERRFANKCQLSRRQLRQQSALSYLWFSTDGRRIDQLGGLCMHRGRCLRPTTSIIHLISFLYIEWRRRHLLITFYGRVVDATDLYKYSPDAVPPIQYVSSHVATDKDPSK